MASQIDVAGLTDIGRKRSTNQDQFLIADLSKSMRVEQTSINISDASTMFGGSQGKLLLVADGMGGHASGEKASAMAIGSIATYVLNSLRWYFRLNPEDDEDFVEDLKSAVSFSNDAIKRAGNRDGNSYGMGTTATLAYVIWPRLYVMHVGDSRCYLIRGDQIERITHDHTIAEAMAAADGVDVGERSRFSNLLWNVLGGTSQNNNITVEAHKAEMQVGDTVLLCSDGLYKHVSDDKFLDVLNDCQSAATACEKLVGLANEAGGSDNITVIVSRFNSPPDSNESTMVETQVPLDSIVGQSNQPTNLHDTDVFIPKQN